MEELDGSAVKKCRTGDRPVKNRRLDEMQKMNERDKNTDRPKSNGARYLSPQEVASLLRECDGWLRDVVLFALHTGIRRGDILSLKWSQVDQGRGELTISNLYTLPLNATAMNILRSKLDNAEKSGYVFSSENGNIVSHHDLGRALRAASSKAGIVAIRFHDLRHTFAANLFRAGVDCYLVGRLLGQRTAGTLVRPLRSLAKLLSRSIDALDKMNLYGTAQYFVTLEVWVRNEKEENAVNDRLQKIHETWEINGSYEHHGWVMKTKKDAFELGHKLMNEFEDFPHKIWRVTNGVGGKILPYKELRNFDE